MHVPIEYFITVVTTLSVVVAVLYRALQKCQHGWLLDVKESRATIRELRDIFTKKTKGTKG